MLTEDELRRLRPYMRNYKISDDAGQYAAVDRTNPLGISSIGVERSVDALIKWMDGRAQR